jgi:hypothetical protein
MVPLTFMAFRNQASAAVPVGLISAVSQYFAPDDNTGRLTELNRTTLAVDEGTKLQDSNSLPGAPPASTAKLNVRGVVLPSLTDLRAIDTSTASRPPPWPAMNGTANSIADDGPVGAPGSAIDHALPL